MVRCDGSERVWFPEPLLDDPTFARPGENTCAWLGRSTVARAAQLRRFLNEHLAAFPVSARADLAHDLDIRWQTAFFELVLGRMLQTLGAHITVEPANEIGRRLDFVAEFSDGIIGVEAISPVINRSVGEQMVLQKPLIEIVERLLPKGWNAMIVDLPPLAPSDSKRDFTDALLELFGELSALNEPQPIELRRVVGEGEIRLNLIPQKFEQPIIAGPGAGYCDDSEQRIRHAVTKKRRRKQARLRDHPILLAINGAGLSTDLDEFDRALFGSTVEHFGRGGRSERTSFLTNGEFTRRVGDKSPTFAGVLAFIRLGPGGGTDPVLYRHPRYAGAFPMAITALEQRRFDRTTEQIIVDNLGVRGVLARLGFPQ